MARLCRSCCGSMPFGLGAESQGSSSSSRISQRSISKHGSTSKNSTVAEEEETTSEESWDSRENEPQDVQEGVKAETPPDFRPPSEMQVQLLAKTWITHVQQRAAKIWSREQVVGMLETIARSVNYTEDPILGDMSPTAPCVQWHGDLSHQQGFPVLSIKKPNNPTATSTYLCRVLAFLFADDASLKLLKQVGGGPGAEMNCGNPRCVRLSHLAGYNTKWAQRYQAQTKAKTTAARKAAPKAVAPKAVAPKAVAPKAVAPKAVAPKAAAPKAAAPKAKS